LGQTLRAGANRPRIGITSGTSEGWDSHGNLWTPLRDGIEESGGEAVWVGAGLFPQLDPAAFKAFLENLDGLLLAGGADLVPQPGIYVGMVSEDDPSYDDQIAELHITSQPDRDAYESPLVHQALEMDMPIFGICRGFQLLNVACGGRLVPDLKTGIRHRAYSQALSSAHLMKPEAGSLAEGEVGGGYVPINSRHHQGVFPGIVAPGLEATAFSPDGVVEVLEDPKRPWRFAVQWHPERTEEETLCRRDRYLFRWFVEQCRRR
jgi:putative glutamine amidotransferase